MLDLAALLHLPCPLIGVAHLLPLPGSPRQSPGLNAVVDRALEDAQALADGGAAAVIIENLGDAPFSGDQVEPHVVAMLAVVASEVRRRFGERLVVGVNALRNDASGALGAAAAAQAAFIRINVHTGTMVTDQGVLQGRARETLLYRRQLGVQVGIAADVLVKHAAPLGPVQLEQVARDTFRRGGADVLIVTGSGTGQPTDPARVDRVRDAVPEAPIWVGSGVTPKRAEALRGRIHGAIVGTWLHRGSDLRAPLDPERVRRVAGSLRE